MKLNGYISIVSSVFKPPRIIFFFFNETKSYHFCFFYNFYRAMIKLSRLTTDSIQGILKDALDFAEGKVMKAKVFL